MRKEGVMNLKFRAYDQQMGIIYPHESVIKKIYNENKTSSYDFFQDRRFIVMQYSNLFTDEGDRICEGDILESKESKVNKLLYYVHRSEQTGNFIIVPFIKKRYYLNKKFTSTVSEASLESVMSNRDVRIVGNAYENSELLGG